MENFISIRSSGLSPVYFFFTEGNGDLTPNPSLTKEIKKIQWKQVISYDIYNSEGNLSRNIRAADVKYLNKFKSGQMTYPEKARPSEEQTT